MGTPDRKPQEHSRKKSGYRDPDRYVPTIFLGFPAAGGPALLLRGL